MNDTVVKNNRKVAQQGPVTRRAAFTPRVDILELPEKLVLYVDLPGVKADGVQVDFERGELTVRARREPATHPGTSLVEEFQPGDYYRAFVLGQDIAADQITAELKNGVLTVHLPRSAAAQPRRINVKGQ
jgi:HSP20 family protein